jgi:hypothetical protein
MAGDHGKPSVSGEQPDGVFSEPIAEVFIFGIVRYVFEREHGNGWSRDRLGFDGFRNDVV